jgi:triosephosphate isomerase
MAGRRPYIGGNWKMNLHREDAVALATALAQRFTSGDTVDVAISPASVYLTAVKEALGSSAIKLAAQNAYFEPNGAYTGEISLSMLSDVGVGVVLAGHSERRHVMGEPDTLINTKVRAALDGGFEVILCVGEQLEQRELGQTNAINAAQIMYGLAGVKSDQLGAVTIAYEPVWAIGTGKTATPDDAQNAHEAIRRVLSQQLGDEVAANMRIQYGGSVKPGNAAELIAQPDIDGFLVGGASLKADDFMAIVDAAV